MKVIDCEQGSEQWIGARLGRITASNFKRIITPVTGELSTSVDTYIAELAADWWLGRPYDISGSGWMERGKEQEPDAREWYAFDRDADVSEVGFVVWDDDERVGASPDGLVGDDGLLEIKTLGAVNHVMAILNPDAFATAHRPQVQGQLLVTGREWCDLIAWHSEMTRVVVRCKRDEPYLEKMREAVLAAADRLGTTMVALGLWEQPERGAWLHG